MFFRLVSWTVLLSLSTTWGDPADLATKVRDCLLCGMAEGVGYLTERDLETLKKEDEGSPCCLWLPQLALHPMSGNAGIVESGATRDANVHSCWRNKFQKVQSQR